MIGLLPLVADHWCVGGGGMRASLLAPFQGAPPLHELHACSASIVCVAFSFLFLDRPAKMVAVQSS